MVPNRRAVQDGVVMPKPGKHINFNNSEYTTEVKGEIEFIRKHPMFGVGITEVEENEPKI